MVRTNEPVDARGMEEGTATMDSDPMDEQRDHEQGGPLPPPVPPPPGTTASPIDKDEAAKQNQAMEDFYKGKKGKTPARYDTKTP